MWRLQAFEHLVFAFGQTLLSAADGRSRRKQRVPTETCWTGSDLHAIADFVPVPQMDKADLLHQAKEFLPTSAVDLKVYGY